MLSPGFTCKAVPDEVPDVKEKLPVKMPVLGPVSVSVTNTPCGLLVDVTLATTVFIALGSKFANGSVIVIIGLELKVKPPGGVLSEMVAVVLLLGVPFGPVTFLREIV